MEIVRIADAREKQRIAREILEALPDWFGIPESREAYIRGSGEEIFLCAREDGEETGFLYLHETGSATAEICVMGVRQQWHRRGTGRALVEEAVREAKQAGYSFLQVKTVQMGRWPEYDDTNRFYLAMGFREFEVFPLLWDERNPCQIYVMAL